MPCGALAWDRITLLVPQDTAMAIWVDPPWTRCISSPAMSHILDARGRQWLMSQILV